MSWTEPQTTLWLYKGVPLNPTYEHTVYFSTGGVNPWQVQKNWFDNNFLAYSYSTDSGSTRNLLSYVRPSSATIRIEIPKATTSSKGRFVNTNNLTFEDFRECNYLIFNNYDSNRNIYGSLGGKYYYAFITYSEYINDSVIELTFVIDPIQTYHFDYEINECYIDRQHVQSDNIGDNLVAESIDIGTDFPLIIAGNLNECQVPNNLCILINRVNGREQTNVTEELEVDGIENVFTLTNNFDRISLVTDRDGDPITAYTYDSSTRTITFDSAPLSGTVTITGSVNLGTTVDSRLQDGIYTPVLAQIFENVVDESVTPGVGQTSTVEVDAFLNEFNEGDIICIYQYPAFMGTPDSETDSWLDLSLPTRLDGFRPQNNKLYTYPYCFIQATNHAGSVATYKWEYFNSLTWSDTVEGVTTTHNGVKFRVDGSIVGLPQACLVPANYRNFSTTSGIQSDFDWDSALILSNFPQCAWAGDTFKAWWAQNKAGFTMSAITGSLSSMAGGFNQGANYYSNGYLPFQMMNYAGYNSGGAHIAQGTALFGSAGAAGGAFMLANGLLNAGSMIAKMYDIKNTPSQTHGQTQTEHLNSKHGLVGFSVYNMCIKSEFAEVVDQFFSRYGYPIHKIQRPKRHVRYYFTYTKTIDCTITGQIPPMYEEQICSILNNGITWWNSSTSIALVNNVWTDYIGNYRTIYDAWNYQNPDSTGNHTIQAIDA